MTEGDLTRKIKKESLFKEIQRLESIVREIRNSDGDSNNNDIDILAYKKVIAAKRSELECL
jgi:7,8-dihydro-6-hydroxymethylpterin-pyrophosphokinase